MLEIDPITAAVADFMQKTLSAVGVPERCALRAVEICPIFIRYLNKKPFLCTNYNRLLLTKKSDHVHCQFLPVSGIFVFYYYVVLGVVGKHSKARFAEVALPALLLGL